MPDVEHLDGLDALLELASIGAHQSLRAYHRLIWKRVNPETPYIHNWSTDAVLDHVQAFFEGQIQRLVIAIPPGGGKTISGSIAGPTWAWLKNPSRRIMAGSYDLPLASRLNRRRRRLLLDKALRWLLKPEYELLRGETGSTFIQNSSQGWMAAISPDGGVSTGEHCDDQLWDDLLKPSHVYSPKRAEVGVFIRETSLSRFKDQNNPRIMSIGQRLHGEDPSGVLMELFPDCEVLEIPAEYDPKRSKTTVLGFKDPRTRAGESFFPARYAEEELKKKRVRMGPAVYGAQYSQDPPGGGGGIFKKEWMRRWDRLPDDPNAIWVGSVDCTFSNTEHSDFVVLQAWCCSGTKAYLVDQIRGQMTFTETCKALKEMSRRHPQVERWMVEVGRAANGDAVVDAMQDEVWAVMGVRHEQGQSKVARAQSVTGIFEAGQVLIPPDTHAPWVLDWIEEHLRFPSEPDDQVDGTSMALNYLRGYMGVDDDAPGPKAKADRGKKFGSRWNSPHQ